MHHLLFLHDIYLFIIKHELIYMPYMNLHKNLLNNQYVYQHNHLPQQMLQIFYLFYINNIFQLMYVLKLFILNNHFHNLRMLQQYLWLYIIILGLLLLLINELFHILHILIQYHHYSNNLLNNQLIYYHYHYHLNIIHLTF